MAVRNLVVGVVLLVTGALGMGCVLVEKRPRAVATPTPTCHPSQYWDGVQCRHKGRGNGARKHDGPPGQGHP
jgi:hypothetical protein